MIGNASQVLTMIPVRDSDRAQQFYTEVLGLNEVVVAAGAPPNYVTQAGDRFLLYVPNEPYTPTHTLATFILDDVGGAVAGLKEKGVQFDHVTIGDMSTGDDSILKSPQGSLAWFKDSEGNTLGLAQTA